MWGGDAGRGDGWWWVVGGVSTRSGLSGKKMRAFTGGEMNTVVGHIEVFVW